MFADVVKYLEDVLDLIAFMLDRLEDGTPPMHPGGMLRKRGEPDRPGYDLVKYVDGRRRSKYIGGDRSPAVIAFKSQIFTRTLYEVLLKDRLAVKKMLRVAREEFRAFDPQSIDSQLKPAHVDHTGSVNKNPAFMSDADWRRAPYRHSSRPVLSREAFVTCDGTRVRSKGELIIYNILVYLGVPFRYEEVITLTDENGRRVTRCPDFIIRRPDGKEVILEYLGMLGDRTYAESNFKKFMLYWRNGYVLNDTLFYITDDVNGILDSEVVMDMIKHNIMWQ